MNRRLVWSLMLVVGAAQPAFAQSRFEVGATPFVGALDPVGAVPRADLLASEIHMIVYGDLGRMWSVGGALRVDDTRSPLGLRAGFARAFGGDVTGQWGCKPPADGGPAGCPAILILIPTEVSVTTASVALTGHVSVDRLHLGADVGLGWVRHAYSWAVRDDVSFSLEPGEATRGGASAHIGVEAGLRLPMTSAGRLVLRYEEIRALSSDPGRPDRWRSLGLGIAVGMSR